MEVSSPTPTPQADELQPAMSTESPIEPVGSPKLLNDMSKGPRPSSRASHHSHHSSRKSSGSGGSNRSGSDSSTHNVAGSIPSIIYWEHEPLEIFQLKVIQLCHDISFDEPSEVYHMKGGRYNRVIGLKFTSRQSDYVLRIPRYERVANTKDQVAVLHYLAKSHSNSITVLAIAAFDSTLDNAIASPYILQEKILGDTLSNV